MAKTIIWLRDDLRLSDNAALYNGAQTGKILPVFIFDNCYEQLGGAVKWWLHYSLKEIKEDFLQHGIKLLILKGEAEEILPNLAKNINANAVFWNRRYEHQAITIDAKVKKILNEQNIQANSFKANLLFEPWEIKTKEGNFYKVFTPFMRACENQGEIKQLLPIPEMKNIDQEDLLGLDVSFKETDIDDLNLLPINPNWTDKFIGLWQFGEKAAQNQLAQFLNSRISDYAKGRDFPTPNKTSLLSPYLRFGQISPLQIWHAAKSYEFSSNDSENTNKFLAEVYWREFSYSLLYYYPDIKTKPIKASFNHFPWQENNEVLQAWKKGQTGYPIVDAGMRQLWQTGVMHNRVRMVVASFLTKHLLIPWQEGEKWFMDTLIDADFASNPANWQWVAGCGADAAPYYRIFNPILQGTKFDPNGQYVRAFVPELQNLSNKYIHCPWQASDMELKLAKIKLGKDYPEPIIDHEKARNRALEAYNTNSHRVP